MLKDDLDFWSSYAGGYSWYYQLINALELCQEELANIEHMIAGYWFNDKSTLRVYGITESGKNFTATFYQSKNWYIPGESVDSLGELKLWN